MSIVRHELQSCCGNRSLLFEIPSPIKREHLQKFIDAGFIAPAHFITAGIFYVDKSPIIASGGFGTTKINVRCGSGKDCFEAINNFEIFLENVLK